MWSISPYLDDTHGQTTICVDMCVCVLSRMRYRGSKRKTSEWLVSCEICCNFVRGAEYHFKVFCIKKKMGADACTHTHTHTHTQIFPSAPDVESIWFQRKVVQPHVGERGDKSQPLDGSEDTFRGVRKPTAFILFPHGNIHRRYLEWHSCRERRRAASAVRGPNVFSATHQILFYALEGMKWKSCTT